MNEQPEKVQGGGPPLSQDQVLYKHLLGFDKEDWKNFLDVYLEVNEGKDEPIVPLLELPVKNGNLSWFIKTYETIGKKRKEDMAANSKVMGEADPRHSHPLLGLSLQVLHYRNQFVLWVLITLS